MFKDKKKIVIVSICVIIVVIIVFNNFLKNEKYENFSVSNSKEEIIENSETDNEQEVEKIKVHITGEVNNPGLIELDAGSRIDDAIILAGGLSQDADTSKTNLAYILSDGEKIYIPSVNDDENIEVLNSLNSNIKVNINNASASELQSIPGVGESTANSIVEYRTKNGKFTSIEDVQNVSGIGQSKFEKMKDYISVK